MTSKQNKIDACHSQINLLTQSLKDLTESQFTKMEETNKIRNVKEKIRQVITHKQEDIKVKQDEMRVKSNSVNIILY